MKIENGRLTAPETRLTKEDFEDLAAELGVVPGLAKKLGDKPSAAMQIVDVATPVTTINTKDGSVQAEKMAQPGDAIMTRLNKDGSPKIGATGELDQWVVDARFLKDLYNPLGKQSQWGELVGSNNEVLFIELPNGGVIKDPWGGPGVQQTSDGVLQYSLTTKETYLNEADGFTTFKVERPVKPVSDEKKLAVKALAPKVG